VPIPGRFDRLGGQLIQTARRTAQLIIMDELGQLERDAKEFQNAVLEALEGGVPVFGVIKKTAAGWVNKVRQHPNVSVIEINMENRDQMPAKLVELFHEFNL
jgi:nucleoside-triphosphatase